MSLRIVLYPDNLGNLTLQLRLNPHFIISSCPSFKQPHLSQWVGTVSYTHLDVYKRQGAGISLDDEVVSNIGKTRHKVEKEN